MNRAHIVKNCILVGTTGLCISCAELLADQGWKIVGVVTNDNGVVSWAHSKDITTYSFQEFSAASIPCAYLFSVINPYILGKNILDNVSCLAVNYHNSLLPKYAGLNSTSWAIINNESYHGVTWHVINENEIDSGNIVAQQKFPISHQLGQK